MITTHMEKPLSQDAFAKVPLIWQGCIEGSCYDIRRVAHSYRLDVKLGWAHGPFHTDVERAFLAAKVVSWFYLSRHPKGLTKFFRTNSDWIRELQLDGFLVIQQNSVDRVKQKLGKHGTAVKAPDPVRIQQQRDLENAVRVARSITNRWQEEDRLQKQR